MKIIIISTYPPKKCGIATFAQDLYQALSNQSNHDIHILALVEDQTENYPTEVIKTIQRNHLDDYLTAADFLNATFDCCIIQHEYGIFGGSAGDYILQLVKKLKIPIISTLHTILQSPSPDEDRVLKALANYSQLITVMTNYAVGLLVNLYQIPASKIARIPHGVPVFDYDQSAAKKKLNLSDKKILLSFGFLGRGKGFETAIKAMSFVQDPQLIYIILGSTHPNVLREEGESYRELLMQKCEEYGIKDRVLFINEFASEELLKLYLTACDMYVTPYPNENQISSGTLSFAIGAGAAVLSTPYLYARDLLENGLGLLFPFKDAQNLAQHVSYLVANPTQLAAYRQKTKDFGITMQWPAVGRTLLQKLDSLV